MPPLRFRTGLVLPLLLFCLAALAPADAAACPLFRSADLSLPQGATLAAAIEGLTPAASQAPVEVLEPADGALVPVDAASPLFRWRDPSARSWLVTLSVDGEPVCKGLLNTPYWVPERALWERIRADAGERTIEAVVSGVGPDGRLVSSGRTTLTVCGDPVAARISFLRKRLPFRTAQQNPNDSQVVVGEFLNLKKPYAPAPAAQAAASAEGPLASGARFLNPVFPDDVELIQNRLKALGIYKGPIDKTFGPQTKRALDHYAVGQGFPKGQWSMGLQKALFQGTGL